MSEKRKVAARFARGIPTPAALYLIADKARKNWNIFRECAQKSSSIKETIFVGFASLLMQG